MKVIIFEDDDSKFEKIKGVLREKGVDERGVNRIESITEFAGIMGNPFDLAVIDLRLPTVKGEKLYGCGTEILEMLRMAGFAGTKTIAITAFDEEGDRLRDQFAAASCMIYNYEQVELWSRALDIVLLQARDKNRYDFVVFTALQEERLPYAGMPGARVQSVTRYGRDHLDFQIGELSGSIVLLPRMGLVDAAATIGYVLANYSPKIIAMSGICGGVTKKSKLGQLLIADPCWEYQSGKWYKDAFMAEPYQAGLREDTRLVLSQLLADNALVSKLEIGFQGERPSSISHPKIVPFASGSAVIADEKRIVGIMEQHRKVAGIDMEAYGFHRTAALVAANLPAFSAKVVVDMANSNKNDKLHAYGCYVSAAFTMKAIAKLLNQ